MLSDIMLSKDDFNYRKNVLFMGVFVSSKISTQHKDSYVEHNITVHLLIKPR